MILVTCYRMRDLVMHYLAEYVTREFIPWLDKRRVRYAFLFEAQDTRENFERYVKDADVVILTGHGMKDLVTGYGYKPIVKACENDKLLAGKNVCAVACLSGAILGHSAVNKGANLYIGFWREACLVLSYDVEDPTNAPIEEIDPLSDELAYPFLDTLFYPAKLLIERKHPAKIYDLTYKRYNYWIDYALKKQTEEWSEVAKCLKWNRDSLVVYPVYELGIERFLVPSSLALCLIFIPRLFSSKHSEHFYHQVQHSRG